MKKAFSIIGIVASAALVLAGIAVMTSLFGYLAAGHVSSPPHESFGSSYDYGYAKFGADFYNYVSNNAGFAAYGAQRAAGNLSEIFDLLRFAIGITMICFGIGGVAAFGVVLGGLKNAMREIPLSREPFSGPIGAGPVDPAQVPFDSPLSPLAAPGVPDFSSPVRADAEPPTPAAAVVLPGDTDTKEKAAPAAAEPHKRTAPTKEGILGTWVLESGCGMRLSNIPDNSNSCVKMEILANGVIHGYKRNSASRAILQWEIVNDVLKIWWGDISNGFGMVNAYEIAGDKMLSTDGSNTVYAKRG